MERMPILDEAKGSFTFDPSLPKDYLKKEKDMRDMKNNIAVSKSKDTDQKKEEVNVMYKPDEVENIIDAKKANKYAPLSPRYNKLNEFKINRDKRHCSSLRGASNI